MQTCPESANGAVARAACANVARTTSSLASWVAAPSLGSVERHGRAGCRAGDCFLGAPLHFRPLAGWHAGASGTFDSSYGPAANIASPKESTAWMTRGVRYRDRRTADPPDATMSHLPPRAVLVFAVVYESGRGGEKDRIANRSGDPIPLLRRHLRRRRRVRPGRDGARSRVLGDRTHLLRLVADALDACTGTTRPRPPRAAATRIGLPTGDVACASVQGVTRRAGCGDYCGAPRGGRSWSIRTRAPLTRSGPSWGAGDIEGRSHGATTSGGRAPMSSQRLHRDSAKEAFSATSTRLSSKAQSAVIARRGEEDGRLGLIPRARGAGRQHSFAGRGCSHACRAVLRDEC